VPLGDAVKDFAMSKPEQAHKKGMNDAMQGKGASKPDPKATDAVNKAYQAGHNKGKAK